MTNGDQIQQGQHGGMSWGNRLFMTFWTAVTIIMIAIAVMMYVSLVPHFTFIGWIMLVALIIFLGCGVSLVVVLTVAQASIWMNRRNLIVAGDVVAYKRPDGTFEHLSAMHVSAGLLPQQALAKEDEEDEPPTPQESDDATIISLYNEGLTLQTICQSTGAKYHRVQKVVARAKQRGLAS